jgi:plasmid stabilization system protein ParE
MREIIYLEQAQEDIAQLNDYIENRCLAPVTAFRYIEGLRGRIHWLRNNADIFPVVPELSFIMGFSIRRLNYEKMTVLYSIEEDVVYIHRIIPQSMVIY